MSAPTETTRPATSGAAADGALALVGEESAEPVLQFLLLKRLPYRTRIAWVAVCVLVAIAIQTALMSALAGVPFLAAAVLLSWVVGFDNRLDRRGLPRDPAWESAPFEKVREIVNLDAAMTRWDQSATDISSGTGFGVWFATGAGVGVLTLVTAGLAGLSAAWIVAVDGATLLLLQWFSGMRGVQRRPDLVLKARHLCDVVPSVQGMIERSGGRVQAQLQMTGPEGGRAPDDARVSVAFDAPKGAVRAVQGQVVLNRVQGVPYPYFYAVVVATPGQGVTERCTAVRLPPNVVREVKHEKGMDLVIVRQATTKTSGYHTSAAVSRGILETAVRIATA